MSGTPSPSEHTPPEDSTDSSPSPGHQASQEAQAHEEEKALRDEIVQLEAQVSALRTQEMYARGGAPADLLRVQGETKVLGDLVRNQQLGVAAAQSLMMECSRTQYSHPLSSRICLKKDWNERRATLLHVSIWDEKLQNAYNYVVARSLSMDDSADRESNRKFETDDGDICFEGVAVIHFPGVKSLRQVFEALCFYLNNMEISISERLGHITVRDDYDVIDGAAFNSRITSSDGNGVTTESNTIGLMQLFEDGDPRFGNEPCAIVTFDCVDEDELYPYQPAVHVRKDI